MDNQKKIGCVIIMHPGQNNYGSSLQGFATIYKINQLGYEYEIIRYNKKRSIKDFVQDMSSLLKIGLIGDLRYRLSKKLDFIFHKEYKRTRAIRTRAVDAFKAKYLDSKSHFYTGYANLCKGSLNYATVMVGSDQVWLEQRCLNSFLDFVNRPNVLKVVYAASCNERNSFFNKASKVRLCKELAKNFQGISVREKFLVPKCRERLGVEVKWVLDPTLLLTSEEYLEVIDSKEGDDPVVFSYILDDTPSKRVIVDSIAKKLGIPCEDGNIVGKVDGHVRKIQPYPSVDDWLRNLHRSRFVVTDSFHGTVFSILFNKPFVTIGNARRGVNRFKSLLELFGLESRIIGQDELSKALSLVCENIDFESVNKILNEERKKSLSFLRDRLSID